MATDRAIRNETVRHRIALSRYSTALVRKVLAQLNRVDADLVQRILQADNEGRDPARLESVLTEVRALQADGWAVARSRLTTDLDELAAIEADWNARLLRQAARTAGIETAFAFTPTSAQIVAAVNARPFQGRFLRDWLVDAEAGAAKRVRETIRQGFIEGLSVSEMARTVRGTRALQYRDGILEISRRGAETLVRTAVTHVAAVASQETYRAMGDLVEAVEWVSTLDARTSVVCAGRDGKVYPLEAGPRPPAHPNCRSTVIPRIKGLEPVERRTYSEWLKEQPDEVQDDVLGRSKAILFRSGKLPLSRFVERSGSELSLEALRKQAGMATETRVLSSIGMISAPERAALEVYTGSGYQGINGYLRGRVRPSGAVREHVAQLDNLLARAKLPADAVLYRGVGADVVEAYRQQGLRPGSVIFDPAFMSTSTDVLEAGNFRNATSGGLLLRIRAPSGSPGLSVERISSAGTAEREVLLARGQRLKVVSYDREKGTLTLDLVPTRRR